MGWIVQKHGELYAQEYGWNTDFEALVAEICAKFLRELDPAGERCWIAERNGIRVGCIMLVRHSRTIAKLRLLLVDPSQRGMGVGNKLVEECLAFARAAGYRKVTLWTQSILSAARKLYEGHGFRKVAVGAARKLRREAGCGNLGAGPVRGTDRPDERCPAMIRKLAAGGYRLYSRKKDPKTGRRRNLGTFKTRAAAEKHERAVQYFKRR